MYSVCTLLKVVGYYDLSDLVNVSDLFPKKSLDGGMGGWGELYPSCFWIFLTLQIH